MGISQPVRNLLLSFSHGTNKTRTAAAFSVFSDFALAVFPVSVLWNLHMEWRLKMSLMFFMGLGAL